MKASSSDAAMRWNACYDRKFLWDYSDSTLAIMFVHRDSEFRLSSFSFSVTKVLLNMCHQLQNNQQEIQYVNCKKIRMFWDSSAQIQFNLSAAKRDDLTVSRLNIQPPPHAGIEQN
jgi:hypothetical protein